MFLSDSLYPIGLDISDLSLKLVQLKKRGDKISIQAWGKADLPVGVFCDGEIKDKETIVKNIKEIINNPQFGKVSSKDVVACLPESKTFIKLIKVEKSPNDIEALIENEIERHIPISLDNMYYDWQIINELSTEYQILIGASPKKLVDDYTDLLSSSGLSVSALEIEPISLSRSLLAEESAKHKVESKNNYCIIDIGATRTSLTLYSQNTILFTVNASLSGNDITDKIAETLKIERRQAEKAKIICGLDENRAQGIVKNILSEMIGTLTKRITEISSFYGHHFPERGKIDKIILCGGGANIKNINKIISEAVGIETVTGDAMMNIEIDGIDKKMKEILVETHTIDFDLPNTNGRMTAKQNNNLNFSTAIGLALRGIYIDEF